MINTGTQLDFHKYFRIIPISIILFLSQGSCRRVPDFHCCIPIKKTGRSNHDEWRQWLAIDPGNSKEYLS